jgi:hypothetical protein
VKNWRTTRFALVASGAALVLGGGTAAADTGSTVLHGPWSGHDTPVHHSFLPPGAFGSVSSVNGDDAVGTCGAAGAAGSFVLTGWKDAVTTVDVTPTTTFAGSLIAPPTFANVCVGKLVGAVGAVSDETVTAAKVFVIRAQTSPAEHGAFGTVTSVNGVTTTGTCGTAATAGAFAVTAWRSSATTVDVTSTTTFNDPWVPAPSFADVCVGSLVGAVGTVSGDPTSGETVTASKVCVVPAMVPPTPGTTPTPSLSSTPAPAPALGDTSAPTAVPAADPTHSQWQPGSWGTVPASADHGWTPPTTHGFSPSGPGAGNGASGGFGNFGTAGNSDQHSGYGPSRAGSGGFSGQDHGRS